MPTEGVGVLAPQRRRELLRTAAREFARAGYEQASLNRIIRECGMSKSSFYHYFAGKDALFDAVVSEIGAALLDALQVPEPRQLAGPEFWSRLGELVDRIALTSESDQSFNDVGRLFYLRDAPAGPGSALRRAWAGMDAWLDRTLATGRAGGAVRDDLPTSLQGRLAVAVLLAMDEWFLEHLHELDTAQRQALAGSQLDTLRRLLAP